MILFLLYYLKLRLGVLLGFHKTANPLHFKWRWNNWKKTRRIRKR